MNSLKYSTIFEDESYNMTKCSSIINMTIVDHHFHHIFIKKQLDILDCFLTHLRSNHVTTFQIFLSLLETLKSSFFESLVSCRTSTYIYSSESNTFIDMEYVSSLCMTIGALQTIDSKSSHSD